MSSLVTNRHLYDRPTIDKTLTMAVTAVASTQVLSIPGKYLIQNVGPHVAYLRMMPTGSTYTAVAAADMPLFPAGSGDRSSVEVTISPTSNNFNDGHNQLHAVCAVGQTASLKITRVTRS